MRCRNIAESASDYLDGQLPWRRRLVVRIHLIICGVCRRYVTQMRLTVDLLKRSGLADAPGRDDDARRLFRSARP